jgi:hypothetical protein
MRFKGKLDAVLIRREIIQKKYETSYYMLKNFRKIQNENLLIEVQLIYWAFDSGHTMCTSLLPKAWINLSDTVHEWPQLLFHLTGYMKTGMYLVETPLFRNCPSKEFCNEIARILPFTENNGLRIFASLG